MILYRLLGNIRKSGYFGIAHSLFTAHFKNVPLRGGQFLLSYRQLVDKVSVVADRDQRSVVSGERVLERLARRYVEVVCRLVEDQKIHLSEHQLRKGETRAFTAREDGYAFRHILRAEKKLCEHAPPSWGMRPTARREPFSCR